MASGALSVRAAATAVLDAIEARDGDLQAFTSVRPELVLADADELDRRLARGEQVGELAGVPVAVKDVIDVAGHPTSYGTPAARPRVAETDAASVARLRAAGALVIGKTRTSELAWRSDTPPTKNPRHPDLSPGGSSGGSAAAVAGGLVPAALGTDTGGSIRWPASLCGCVGLKPTYGAVDLGGVLSCSPTLDHVGVLAGSVADARAVLAVLATRPSLAAELRAPSRPAAAGARIGLIEEPLLAIADEPSRRAFEDSVATLRDGGAELVPLELAELSFAPAAMLAISLADAMLFPEEIAENAALLHDDVQVQLRAAAKLPAALVVQAQQTRRLLQRRVAGLFRDHGLAALLLPGTVEPPPRRGVTASAHASGVFYLASLTGQPAVVLPAADDGAPVSIQLVGRPFGDAALLDLALELERPQTS